MYLKIRKKFYFSLLMLLFFSGFRLMDRLRAEEGPQMAAPEITDSTKIVISASGPVKFDSYWLDDPYRLVVEFKSRNVLGNIDKEMAVNQGLIKKIASVYFNGRRNVLKTLTFELTEKVPYEIWQEDKAIILDIQAPLKASGFTVDAKRKEILATTEADDKRLDAMDMALKQAVDSQVPSGIFPATAIGIGQGVSEAKIETSSLKNNTSLTAAKESTKRKKSMLSMLFWLVGITTISSLGFSFWRKGKVYNSKDKEIMNNKIKELELALKEKNNLLGQEEIIRKTVEKTSIEREKEHEQLKLELQKKTKHLEHEEGARKAKEKELSQKEKEHEEVKNSLESLKGVLVEKGLAKKLTSPAEKEELWIAGKSPEKRDFPRLDLTRDYNRTIILRIESHDKSKSIKSFANNISLGGLCFESRTEFKEKEVVNLRLFFFGEKVPMMRIRAKLIWSKADSPVNHYGISFVSLEEKDKTELSRYIESKIARG